VVVLATALFALGGLVLDGSRAITGRQRAANEAERARPAPTRCPSTPCAVTAPSYWTRSGSAPPRPPTWPRPGDTGRIGVTPTSCHLRVEVIVDTVILGIVGVNTLTVSNTASARAVRDIDTQEP
jgi:hypothetical protein